MRSRASYEQRIAVAAVTAVTAILAIAVAIPRAASADEGRAPRVAVFGTLSPVAGFDYMGSDGHGPSADFPSMEIGLGGAATWRPLGWFEAGLGLHYDFANSGGDRVHFMAAPLTAALVAQMAGGRELRFGIGFGAVLGLAAGQAADYGVLTMLGASAEAGFGYAQPVAGDGKIGFVQVGARFDLIPELNADPDWYLSGGEMIHAQFPFVRVGLGWR